MPSVSLAPLADGPAFLRGLDHVLPTDEGWIAQCPVFGCQEILEITRGTAWWKLVCREHDEDEIVDYLQADTRLDPVAATRGWRAMMLASTPAIWQALLEGQDVPVSALDPLWARRFGLR